MASATINAISLDIDAATSKNITSKTLQKGYTYKLTKL